MFCIKCHYDLKGNTSNACPECGRAFDPADPDSYLVKPLSLLARHPRWVAFLATIELGVAYVALCLIAREPFDFGTAALLGELAIPATLVALYAWFIDRWGAPWFAMLGMLSVELAVIASGITRGRVIYPSAFERLGDGDWQAVACLTIIAATGVATVAAQRLARAVIWRSSSPREAARRAADRRHLLVSLAVLAAFPIVLWFGRGFGLLLVGTGVGWATSVIWLALLRPRHR